MTKKTYVVPDKDVKHPYITEGKSYELQSCSGGFFVKGDFGLDVHVELVRVEDPGGALVFSCRPVENEKISKGPAKKIYAQTDYVPDGLPITAGKEYEVLGEHLPQKLFRVADDTGQEVTMSWASAAKWQRIERGEPAPTPTPTTISMGKQYTDEGAENQWRILCVDAPGALPVVAVNQHGSVRKFTIEGRIRADAACPGDLIEAKPRVQCEVWLYRDALGGIVACEAEDRAALPEEWRLVARVAIDVPEGYGLEEGEC